MCVVTLLDKHTLEIKFKVEKIGSRLCDVFRTFP